MSNQPTANSLQSNNQDKQTEGQGIAIKVNGVSKTFKLPHEKQSSLKGTFLSSFRPKKFEMQEALKDINFEVKKGEFFGIVGRNGSGKSTLLKCIAGVYVPNHGSIKVNGSLVPFIELGVGFNPELSGRDNVFLNGALLGFSRKQMETMYDEIVEFAELEQFMDQKLKNYSSGMQVRLAFSIAIRAKGDILLLDEVLAVGDAAFQTKCFDYFQQLKNDETTVIFVSHDKSSLERFCDRGILISDGGLISEGSIKKILADYSRIVLDEIEKAGSPKKEGPKKARRSSQTLQASIINANTYNNDGNLQKKFTVGEKILVKYVVKVERKIENPIFGITIWEKNVKKPIFVTNTLAEGNTKTGIFQAGSSIDYNVELPPNLNDGEYYIEPAIANESASVFLDQQPKASTFYIRGGEQQYSIVTSGNRSNLVVVKNKK